MEPGRCRAPSTAGRRRETLSSSRHRGQGTVVHTGSSAVKGGDGRGLEASDDQPDAWRTLAVSGRECGYQRGSGRSADEVEEKGEVWCGGHGRSDESEQRKNARLQARPEQQEAQQQAVHRWYEAPRDEEYPVIDGDQRMAGDQRLCACSGLSQAHDRQHAHDASEEAAGLQSSGADEAHRDPFVLPLEHRVQRDGGADAGEGHDDLEDGADERASVRAGAENVVRTSHRTVESEGRDRDKSEQVEHTRGKRGLSVWTHLALIGGRRFRGDHDMTLLLFVGVIGTMTVWEVRLMTSEPCSASRNG